MKKLAIIIVLFLFILACQESSKDIIAPAPDNDFSIYKLSKVNMTDDLMIYESGFNAYLLIDKLSNPEGVTYHPKTNELLVGQSSIGNILAFNSYGNRRQFCKIPFEEPPAPALIDLLNDPLREVFATLLRHGQIFNIDNAGNATEFVSDLNFPLFMELDSKHNLYVSELNERCITKINPLGNKTKVIDFEEVWNWYPRGIVFDRRERLYVLSNWRTKEIRRYNIHNTSNYPMALSNSKLIATLTDSNNPQDVTIGFDEDLFVVGQNNIWRVKLNGEITKFASGLTGRYNTIYSTRSGELVITDYGEGKVYGISRHIFAIN